MKTLIYRTKTNGELCFLLPEEKQRIVFATGRLRNNPSAMYKQLRRLFIEKGIDANSSFLAQFFTDGHAIEFGIIVSSRTQIFQFDYDWFHCDEGSGHFSQWRQVPEEYSGKNWKEQIELSLELVEEAAEPGAKAMQSSP